LLFSFQRTFCATSLDQASPVASMYSDEDTDWHQDGAEYGHDQQSDKLVAPEYFFRYLRSKRTYKIEFISGLDLSTEQHLQYLIQLLDDICTFLLESLDSIENRLALAPDPLNDEAKQHLAFAKLRAERFSPTGSSRAALDRAKEWMLEAVGKTFILYGPSGAGKTYVVAKLVSDLISEETALCVVRFLGTSGGSADVSSLLRSICHQLRSISVGREGYISGSESGIGLPPCPVAHEDLVKYFGEAIKTWAWGRLVLALESLDQLNDTNAGRELDWLPLDGHSSTVQIVCSTLPDEIKPEVGRPFRCLSILRNRIPDTSRFVEVTALKDSAQLIAHLLKLRNRRVTETQLSILVQTMEKAEKSAQTPLMATLISGKASQWRSSTLISRPLPSSVRGIILDFFGDLVSHFRTVEGTKQAGARLVKHALSYITLVNKGVSDTELQEILSLDDDVLADSHQWWFTPDKKMPSAPLLLLFRMLAPYLSCRAEKSGGTLVVWYHRQMWEAAEAHFLSDDDFRGTCHHTLSEFFSGRFAGKEKPCNYSLRVRLGFLDQDVSKGVNRHVRVQPLVLSGVSAFHPGVTINERRCTEAMQHMVKEMQILKKLEQEPDVRNICERIICCSKMVQGELCSSEAVCARAIAGETFNLVWQSATFLQLVSSKDIDYRMVDHFNRWIRRDAHEFFCPGRLVASALRQPLTSKALEEYLCSSRQRVPGLPWLMLGGQMEDYDAVISVLKRHEGRVYCTDWHESKLVSGDDNGVIIVWDALTGERTLELRGHSEQANSVRWSPKGDQILSGSYDKTCIIWDATTGDKVSELKGHAKCVNSVAWSPKGDKVLSGSSDNTCIIWDAATGDKVCKLEGHTDEVCGVAWSGDRVVSCSDDKTLIIWDSTTGKQVSKLEGHTNLVMSVAWSPKGDKILSGSADRTCIIWDAATGDKISQLESHTDWVRGVAWSGDKIVSCSDDKTLIIWDAASGKQVSKLEGHSGEVMSVAWSPKGNQVLSGSADTTCIIWNAAAGVKVSELKGHKNCVNSVAWSGDQIVSGSFDATLIIWDAQTGDKVSQLKGHTKDVNSVAWSPKGDQILSGSLDKTCIIWNAATGDKVSELKGHTGSVNSVAWSPKGDMILSGSGDETCIIWDAATGDKVSELRGHTRHVNSAAWSPKGDQILSGSYDNTCIIWDAATGNRISRLEGHTGHVNCVAWKEDQIVSCSEDKTLIIWDATSGRQISKLEGHADKVMSVAWSPVANQLVSGSQDKTAIVWDAANGEKISELKGHTGWVRSVSWSNDGKQIATGSDDKTVLVWDAAKGEQVSKLEGHTDT
jgi:WD40 repeat protein